MSAPRLEIDITKIKYNTSTLVKRLISRGITVTGVTKAIQELPEIAEAMICGGAESLGDSRIENIEVMRRNNVTAPINLIRGPMLSQIDRVVQAADISFNSELAVIKQLSLSARTAQKIHGIVLMIELGDLREGILPEDIDAFVAQVLVLPNIKLKGIATNLACLNGVIPDHKNMGTLSALAINIEKSYDISLDIVSGGNSANLQWALGRDDPGRINNLRLGEAILLGRDPLYGEAIEGLYVDAFEIVGEVIESKVKPSKPVGSRAQTPFIPLERPKTKGLVRQTILALGHQDTDPAGLASMDFEVLGASSDHLIIKDDLELLKIGSEVVFQPNYSALIRAIASPFVAKVVKHKIIRETSTQAL